LVNCISLPYHLNLSFQIMNIAVTVVAFGILVFLAHLFAEIFSRRRIPDVLLLIIIGLIIGPVFGIVTPGDFGLIGPVFTTITLVTILFEGGTELRLDTIRNVIKGTILLTFLNFIATMAIVGLIGWLLFDWPPMVSFMLGAIIGGTSAAVVVPIVRHLNMSKNSSTILIFESAFSDVLCIVVALAFLSGVQLGGMNWGNMLGQILASFVLATILGLIGAYFWSVILHRIRTIKNSIFTTPAFVFVIFGISELLGYSGAIAALAFGIGLANINSVNLSKFGTYFDKKHESLNETERILFAEIVFLLKTFFFVYVGISIQLNDLYPVLIGLAITIILFLVRIPVIRASMPRTTVKNDLFFMSAIVPKGLAAAVLATIPLQQSIEYGEMIMNITFSVILFSIAFTSALIPLIEKHGSVRRFYNNSLNANLWMRLAIHRYQQKRALYNNKSDDKPDKDRASKTDTTDSEQKSVDKKPHDKV
jgi:potassium/hydrogen antiporter